MGYVFLVVIIAGAICGYIFYKKVDEPKMNRRERKVSEEQIIIDDVLGTDKEGKESREGFNEGE